MPSASTISLFATAASANVNMTCRQMALLCAVAEDAGHSNRIYVDRFGWPPPVVTRAIDALQADGLVLRRTSPDDRRKTVLTVTRKGAALVERLGGVA